MPVLLTDFDGYLEKAFDTSAIKEKKKNLDGKT